MTQINQDFTTYSGDDLDLRVTVRSSINSNPVDITGVSATWVAKRSPDAPAVITKTTGSGITLTTPTTGQLTITLASSDTADITGDLLHELQVVDVGGKVSTVMRGRMRVKQRLVD